MLTDTLVSTDSDSELSGSLWPVWDEKCRLPLVASTIRPGFSASAVLIVWYRYVCVCASGNTVLYSTVIRDHHTHKRYLLCANGLKISPMLCSPILAYRPPKGYVPRFLWPGSHFRVTQSPHSV